MPDITPAVRPQSEPVRLIAESVNAALKLGLTVSTVPDLGVHCTSTHAPRWEREQRVQVVSPLGAVLLTMQPAVRDADKALAHALGVGRLWVVGFDEACAGTPPTAALANGPAAQLYGEGYAAGAQFRAIMHRRAGVPTERADDRFSPEASMSAGPENHAPKSRYHFDSDAVRETTRPINTPSSVLSELLSALTVSQGLEALADSFHERMGDMGADQAAELRIFEQTLRELADEARGAEG